MVRIQRLAAAVLGRVSAGRSLTEVLAETWGRHPGLSAQERAAIQDLSYGTLRFYGQLGAVLDRLLKKPLQDEDLRALLLAGLYQLNYTKAAPYAVVDHAVTAAETLGKGGAKGLVNAVLRNFLRARQGLLAQATQTDVGRYSHPQWWIDRVKRQYPHAFEAILNANNQRAPMTLRVNQRKLSPQAYLDLLFQEGLAAQLIGGAAIMLAQPVPVDRLPGFAEGAVSVQDAGAQQAALLLGASDGMRVLDACAAPGGKTAHLLESVPLELTAVDNDPVRLVRLNENLARLALEARVVQGDAAQPEQWWDGTPFDRILADVPCSASGVARRHPDIKWLRRDADIPKFAREQRRLLDGLWRLLARDGKLLYATCSVFAEENQMVIQAFLSHHDDAQSISLTGRDLLDGQLLPDLQHDGFYYALLRKA